MGERLTKLRDCMLICCQVARAVWCKSTGPVPLGERAATSFPHSVHRQGRCNSSGLPATFPSSRPGQLAFVQFTPCTGTHDQAIFGTGHDSWLSCSSLHAPRTMIRQSLGPRRQPARLQIIPCTRSHAHAVSRYLFLQTQWNESCGDIPKTRSCNVWDLADSWRSCKAFPALGPMLMQSWGPPSKKTGRLLCGHSKFISFAKRATHAG